MKPIQHLIAALIVLGPASASAQRISDACVTHSECRSGDMCIAGNCLDGGKLLVTLSWPASTDLDLVLRTPTGAQISAALDGTPRADGGELRRDECYHASTCEDDSGHLNVEHISWAWGKAVPGGEFEVWAVNFDGRAPAELSIRVEHPDGLVQEFTGGIEGEPGAESQRFRFVAQDTVCDVDTDRDGLCDKWEKEGIDIDGDGVIDLDLPARGANPLHKDLFVEVDRFAGQKVFPLGGVVAAFAKAPVENPDGRPGITLHIEMSDEIDRYGTTPVVESTPFDHEDIAVVKYGTAEEEEGSHACDKGWFGSASDRKSPNCRNIMKARKQVYRYALYVASLTIGGYSGVGELAGNDFIVSVGSWSNNSQAIQQGTFMHELGHTLGLGHGGGDHDNCKPNHLSVMNYLYQFPSSYAGRPLAFGPQLPQLDEAALIEADGIAGPASWAQVVFATPAALVTTKTDASAPIDWNQDGDAADTHSGTVSSGNFPCGGQRAMRAHPTIAEWQGLRLDFRNTGGFNAVFPAPDFGGTEDATSELDENAYEQMARASDSDDDGLSNLDDNCPTVANPAQDDRDDDGVGDVCDACPDTAAPGYTDGCPETPADDEDPAATEGSPTTTGDADPRSEPSDNREETVFLRPDKGCTTAAGGTGAGPLLLFGGLLFGADRRRRRVRSTR